MSDPRRDFTGTWLADLDATKHKGKRVLVCGISNEFEIAHDGQKVIFTSRQDGRSLPDAVMGGTIYYTDSRGEFNTGDSQPLSSTTMWKGKRLVTKFDGTGTIVGATSEWYLSKDRQKLFRKLVVEHQVENGSNGSQRSQKATFSYLYVYNRVAEPTAGRR